MEKQFWLQRINRKGLRGRLEGRLEVDTMDPMRNEAWSKGMKRVE